MSWLGLVTGAAGARLNRPKGRSHIMVPGGGANAEGWTAFRDALARIEAYTSQAGPTPVRFSVHLTIISSALNNTAGGRSCLVGALAACHCDCDGERCDTATCKLASCAVARPPPCQEVDHLKGCV